MESVYQLYQHRFCMVTFIREKEFYFELYDTLTNESPTKVASLTDTGDYNSPLHFMDGLLLIYQKSISGKRYKKRDERLFKAICDILDLARKNLIEQLLLLKQDPVLFYVFVTPSEWEEEIREDLITPIFIKAHLINENGNEGRLLFFSDMESIYYNLRINFERGQNTFICRFDIIDSDTILVKLDFFKTTNALFDIPKPKKFLKEKIFLDTEVEIYDQFIDKAKEYVFKYVDSAMIDNYIYDWNPSKFYSWLRNPIFTDKSNPEMILLNSICPFDIFVMIGQTLFSEICDTISSRLLKKCILFVLYFENGYKHPLYTWLDFTLGARSKLILNHFGANLTRVELGNNGITQDFISKGTLNAVVQAIINSNIYCCPRIRFTENKHSASMFPSSEAADIIINIDISLDSTLLSCYFFNENGSILGVWDHNYFTETTYLPSLGYFLNLSNDVVLNIRKQFILFADNFLFNYDDSLFTYKLFLNMIELLMSNKTTDQDELIYIHQKNYFKGLLLMYLIYVKKIVSSGLFLDKFKHKLIRSGYAISVEKIILDNVIGNIEDLEQLVYKSGLTLKDISLQRLRIITKAEGILSNIQRVFNLEFPLKSYFVFAQIHEEYIQLTLNRVVTESTLEDPEQEAIIVEDKIIPINNIYDSLFEEMWNNLIQNSSLIRQCLLHNKRYHKREKFEKFCLYTKKVFMSNFKQFIIDNILSVNEKLPKFRKVNIRLSQKCYCHVYLSINDIIEISFKPFLKDITSILLSPLIDKFSFGRYNPIEYHFSLMHFNHNLEFHEILAIIMKEEARLYKPIRGIEASCYMLRKSQFFLPEASFLYKGFQKGTLYQIYDRNYTLKVDTENTRSDPMLFPILKQDDRVGQIELNREFNFFREKNSKIFILFANEEFIFEREVFITETDFRYSQKPNQRNKKIGPILYYPFDFVDLINSSDSFSPLIVTVKSLEFSSSIEISVKSLDDHYESNKPYLKINLGLPLTLCRF